MLIRCFYMLTTIVNLVWLQQSSYRFVHVNVNKSLASCHKQAKLCHLFKIVHGLTDCQCAPVICKRPLYNTRQVSNLSLQDISVNTSQFCIYFTPIPYSCGILYPLITGCSLHVHCIHLKDHCLSSLLIYFMGYHALY